MRYVHNSVVLNVIRHFVGILRGIVFISIILFCKFVYCYLFYCCLFYCCFIYKILFI